MVAITASAKSIIPICFDSVGNCSRNQSHLPQYCNLSSSPRIVCDLRRRKSRSPLSVLIAISMMNRTHSRKSSSDSMGTNESSDETEAIIGNRFSSASAPSSRGFNHYVNKASKWAISVTFAAIVVWKHDGGVMWAVSGSVFNTGSSRILKYLFNHERPLSALSLKTDPGMPSSHAQSIGYLAMYAALSLISWQGFSALTVVGGLAILICGAYLAWLRVSEGLHTYAQVLVGALLGAVAAIAWFSLWKAVVLKSFTSFLWVKITLYVGSVIVCLGFLAFVVRTWRFGEV